MTTSKFDIYQHVSDQIAAMMETAGTDWTKPWRTSAHANVVSGKAYRGVNVFLTWAAAANNGYASRHWGTYKQWAAKGYQVQKGEKATPVTFWKMLDKDEGRDANGEKIVGKIPLLRWYYVFNGDQVRNEAGEKFVSPSIETLPETERNAGADAVIAATGAAINYAGTSAFYRPDADEITLPDFSHFKTASGFYATALHELAHWTGHKSRLNRLKGAAFGSEDYAFEELIAESASAFLCADLGLAATPSPDHAKYLKNWIKATRNDKRAIFRAFSAARKAAEFINPKKGEEAEQEAA